MAGVPLNPEDVSPLLTGENIPRAQLPDADGKLTDLHALVAKRPSILVFYRGGWCPYCNRQLSGLQEIEQDLNKMGYQLIAISTDSPENLRQTGEKQHLSYTLLSDADLALSKKFGIAYKSPENYDKFLPATSGGKNTNKLLPVPSVFIVNRKGNIRFEYINPDFRERLNPGLLKAAAAALMKEGLHE
ncbi:peroxiredoxin [Chitinophaga cymbidii]|uniref:thioredoxin-dependent peroxiredoxin n=2 Tax=Chitinophaga cymbidii TaxID=1096750 RepID=A0A512RQR4_9BACT|nr:peroxiredoxin [Chitinophaga cymbidii]